MKIVLAAFMAALSLFAGAPAAVATGQTLTCVFSAGVVQTFENGSFKQEKVSQLTMTFGDIDLDRQTAALVTPQGKGELKIVRAIGANHFLEVVTEGFLNMTTIYDPPRTGAPRPAVHSRHLGVVGTPVVSQYYGTCKSG